MKALFISTIAATPLFAADLNIYTYDSFASEWGPGPVIEEIFEKECGCDITFTTAGDGAALLTRLRLEGKNSEADIVLGIDQNLVESAEETGFFVPHELGASAISGTTMNWDHPDFLPYDWGHFAFVYRKADLETPPENFDALADSDLKIVIQDPRSSTPGLGLVSWIYEVYGEEAPAYWERLSDNVVTVTPGWSEAYSLFLEGQADMVLSYTTSPAYHKIAESDDGFAAAKFDEGHALQVELMGITERGAKNDLAKDFVAFIQSPVAQEDINMTNWMYPVAPIDIPEGFADPSTYKTLETSSSQSDLDLAKAAYEAGMK